MEVLQHSFTVVPGVWWHGRTELTEIPGSYTNAVPVPRVFVARRTEIAAEVAGTGMNIVQNLPTFRVRV